MQSTPYQACVAQAQNSFFSVVENRASAPPIPLPADRAELLPMQAAAVFATVVFSNSRIKARGSPQRADARMNPLTENSFADTPYDGNQN
ncbi:hypothetical protein D1O30_16270 [Methylocystis hirsuta]|uniref:Uncharacterized protein n=1 Tax=Methylocystis hirsuta TaxID=369798 RepID=A0A3M9XRK0_9HYPH|nr:hypothetical protein D1O30_16270 [Methylocystis hirsuta]